MKQIKIEFKAGEPEVVKAKEIDVVPMEGMVEVEITPKESVGRPFTNFYPVSDIKSITIGEVA